MGSPRYADPALTNPQRKRGQKTTLANPAGSFGHFIAVRALLRKPANSSGLSIKPLSYSASLVSVLPFTASTT